MFHDLDIGRVERQRAGVVCRYRQPVNRGIDGLANGTDAVEHRARVLVRQLDLQPYSRKPLVFRQQQAHRAALVRELLEAGYEVAVLRERFANDAELRDRHGAADKRQAAQQRGYVFQQPVVRAAEKAVRRLQDDEDRVPPVVQRRDLSVSDQQRVVAVEVGRVVTVELEPADTRRRYDSYRHEYDNRNAFPDGKRCRHTTLPERCVGLQLVLPVPVGPVDVARDVL